MFSISDFASYIYDRARSRRLLSSADTLKSIHSVQFGKNIQAITNNFSGDAESVPSGIKAEIATYLFFKALEYHVSYEVYGRLGLHDTYYSFEEIGNPPFRTNLPHHLDRLIQYHSNEASGLVDDLLNYKNQYCASDLDERAFWFAAWNYTQSIGDIFGNILGLATRTIGSYANADILTMREIREISGNTFINQLADHGYEINTCDFGFDPYYNIVAKNGASTFFILVSAEVSPTEPSFKPFELDKLFDISQEQGALPYFASLSIRSADNSHYEDGVIIRGDKAKVRINAFNELELED